MNPGVPALGNKISLSFKIANPKSDITTSKGLL
jgi:hypothetical protein